MTDSIKGVVTNLYEIRKSLHEMNIKQIQLCSEAINVINKLIKQLEDNMLENDDEDTVREMRIKYAINCNDLWRLTADDRHV